MDYIEAFRNLKTNRKYRRKSPHKAILLLSIIEMYENNLMTNNQILYNADLESTFERVWNRCLPAESTFLPEPYIPFWYMQSESFWHIVPQPGRNSVLGLMQDEKVKPSEKTIKDYVKYAELDENLFFLITMKSGRTDLKRVLLEHYTNLPEYEIEKLSKSIDTEINDSTFAIKEYEELLNKSSFEKRQNLGEYACIQNGLSELSEDVQIILNYEYYSFLKNHRYERALFKKLFPSVENLYDCIMGKQFKQEDVPSTFLFSFENFLNDLKISLMGEDDSINIVDNIEDALTVLRGENDTNDLLDVSHDNNSSPNTFNLIETPIHNSFIDYSDKKKHLTPALEDNSDKPWTSDDDNKISVYYQLDYSPKEISEAIGRPQKTVMMRIKKLGLAKENKQSTTTYEKDQSSGQFKDLYVINTSNESVLCNLKGDILFQVSGKMKIIGNNCFRFNMKNQCFTVKRVTFSNGIWDKSEKLIVAYPDSDLFSEIDFDNCYYQIEAMTINKDWSDNRILVDGKWYNFKGYYLTDEK